MQGVIYVAGGHSGFWVESGLWVGRRESKETERGSVVAAQVGEGEKVTWNLDPGRSGADGDWLLPGGSGWGKTSFGIYHHSLVGIGKIMVPFGKIWCLVKSNQTERFMILKRITLAQPTG